MVGCAVACTLLSLAFLLSPRRARGSGDADKAEVQGPGRPVCPEGVPVREVAIKILYGILFRDEFEVLEILLSELFDVVDTFIILEASHTFSGSAKLTSYLHAEYHRFQRFSTKIHRLRVGIPAKCAEELDLCLQHMRGTMALGATDKVTPERRIKGDDLLIIADADEILSAAAVRRLRHCRDRTPVLFGLRHFVYSLGWEVLPPSPDVRRLPNQAACRTSGIVAATVNELEEIARNLGSAGAVRHRSWRLDGPGNNATCLRSVPMGPDRTQGATYRTANGQNCPNGRDITDEEACKSAASQLGLVFAISWYGPGDHRYCLFADDGRSKVYFNTASSAGPPKAAYASICQVYEAAGRVRAEPAGWHLALQGGWRQVRRALISRGDPRLLRYSSQQAALRLIWEGRVPSELGWGKRTRRVTWQPREKLAKLPRSFSANAGSLPWMDCWLDSSAPNCVEHGAELRPRPAVPAATPSPAAPTTAVSQEECWSEVIAMAPILQIPRIGDFPLQNLCCMMGGHQNCWRPEAGRTYKACCGGVLSISCLEVGEDRGCWSLAKAPQDLLHVVEIALMYQQGRHEYSHVELIGRVLMTMAIGSGAAADRPDHAGGGTYPGLDLIEVGVERGEFAERMLSFLVDEVGVPVRRYTLVDKWAENTAASQTYVHEKDDVSDSDHANHLAKAAHRIGHGWPGKARFLNVDSLTAARWLQRDGEQADFVFIDALHDYDSVWDDLVAWWPLVKVGGLFAGHDYVQNTLDRMNVKRAVDEFAEGLGLLDQVVAPIHRCWLLPKAFDVPPPTRPDWLRPE